MLFLVALLAALGLAQGKVTKGNMHTTEDDGPTFKFIEKFCYSDSRSPPPLPRTAAHPLRARADCSPPRRARFPRTEKGGSGQYKLTVPDDREVPEGQKLAIFADAKWADIYPVKDDFDCAQVMNVSTFCAAVPHRVPRGTHRGGRRSAARVDRAAAGAQRAWGNREKRARAAPSFPPAPARAPSARALLPRYRC